MPRLKCFSHKNESCCLFSASCNISSTRNSVSSGYPNSEKRVENTTRSRVFLARFEVFRQPMKHSLECLIQLLNRNKNKRVNGRVKSSKSLLNEPDFQTSFTLVIWRPWPSVVWVWNPVLTRFQVNAWQIIHNGVRDLGNCEGTIKRLPHLPRSSQVKSKRNRENGQ